MEKKKHKDYRFLLFLMPQQRYQHLLTATVQVIITIILTVNLHTFCKTFTWHIQIQIITDLRPIEDILLILEDF